MSQKRLTPEDEPYLAIRTATGAFADGAEINAHSHPWGQLIYATSGVQSVWTSEGSWVAPPGWAIWAPAGVRHSIRFTGAARLCTLYLDPALSGLPARSVVITVSPLLRELIVRAVTVGMLDRRDALHRALTTVILSEIRVHPTASLELPQPSSARISQVAAAILASPGKRHPHRALARQFGIGIRALERGFVTETGLALGQWQRQARFLHAIRRLGGGASVKEAALDAGYQSASAFIAAFRGVFHTTPARYFPGPDAVS
jgi:AraC-like DNA-binding protein